MKFSENISRVMIGWVEGWIGRLVGWLVWEDNEEGEEKKRRKEAGCIKKLHFKLSASSSSL